MDAAQTRLPDQSDAAWGWRDIVVLLAAAALLIAVRMHAFALPLETDECNYIYIGSRLLEGSRLYVDIWDHQPPGIFWLFAAVIALFGDGEAVFRWLAVAASAASLFFIFDIVRRSAGRRAGWFAAGLFALLSADPGTAGEGCNREIFMNPLALAAVWMLVRRSEAPARWSIISAGVLLGLGSTVKTVMAAQWLLLAVWLAWIARTSVSTGQRWRRSLTRLGLFAVGPAAVWIAVFAYFSATGRFEDFYDAVFRFNVGYSETAPVYWQRFVDFFRAPVHRHVFDGTGSLWIAGGAAAVALLMLPRGRFPRFGSGALLSYLLGSYLAVCLPGQFWPHYYYLMLPPLVVVVAVTIGRAAALPANSPYATRARWAALAAAAALTFALLVAQAGEYLLVPSVRITEKRYKTRDLWARAQAENVAAVTDPGDTVMVYGKDVGIYYYSGRRCASRYTMVGGLADGAVGFEKRRAILLDELRQTRPRVVLIVDELPFPALDAFLQDGYTLVGVDYHDVQPDQAIMEAWMDKSRPIRQVNWNWDRSTVYGQD